MHSAVTVSRSIRTASLEINIRKTAHSCIPHSDVGIRDAYADFVAMPRGRDRWAVRAGSRRGHQHVISASAALGEAYAFPAQDARTAHLGYQLAWLDTSGDLAARMAAASTAEGLTASPTLDPTIETQQRLISLS